MASQVYKLNPDLNHKERFKFKDTLKWFEIKWHFQRNSVNCKPNTTFQRNSWVFKEI